LPARKSKTYWLTSGIVVLVLGPHISAIHADTKEQHGYDGDKEGRSVWKVETGCMGKNHWVFILSGHQVMRKKKAAWSGTLAATFSG
jgi:hypothetical protein